MQDDSLQINLANEKKIKKSYLKTCAKCPLPSNNQFHVVGYVVQHSHAGYRPKNAQNINP